MAQYSERHYFASSVFGWNVSNDPDDARETRLRLDGHSRDLEGFEVWVFQVPGPIDAKYKIRSFKPQVEGAEMVEKYIA